MVGGTGGRGPAFAASDNSRAGASPDSPASVSSGGVADASRIPQQQIFAVTVTFNPRLEDGRLGSQVADVSRHCGFHVIVDNHSENFGEIKAVAERRALHPLRIHVVPLERNVGIARALNVGVARCRELGEPSWILTLDQDTTFPEGAFPSMEREIAHLEGFEQTGIVAFNYLEHRFNSVRPYNHARGPLRVRSIISSGNLVRNSLFDQIQFDERLFLYFVDVDFCRKVRSLGYSIVVLRTAFIDHEEGRRVERDGRTMYYLDPTRLFYISRNGFVMFARYRTLQDPVIAAYLVAMNVATGSRPLASLREAIRGILSAPAFLRAES